MPIDPKEWLAQESNVRGLLPAELVVFEHLAGGGQGVVFKGQFDGKPAAVKIYFPGQVAKRIERELSALLEISCPSIVRLYWSGKIDSPFGELHVAATQLVEGDDLSILIERVGGIGEPAARKIALGIAIAIDALWARRIVHRDIKPPNIIVGADKTTLIDLGIARHIGMSSMTAQGSTWGTIGYLSPEQMNAVRMLTCKSDVFALGVVILESLCGRHPTNRDQYQLAASTKWHRAALPAAAASVDWIGLVQDMLHPRPTKRPSPSEIVKVLTRETER